MSKSNQVRKIKMNRNIFLAAAIAAALCAGCGRRTSTPVQTKEQTSSHSHEGHDHSEDHGGHDHSDAEHDHSAHDHAAQDHTGHGDADHADHDHDSHSCDAYEGHNHGEGRAGAETYSDEIIFTPEQAARTEFEVLPAARGHFREVIKCSGTVAAARGALNVITAPISGIVTLADGHVMENSEVGKGQRLFTITSGGLASGDAVAKARIAYDLAKADFDRVGRLYEDKLATNREYLAAEAEYLRAKAEYDPVSRTDSRGGTVIEATAGGYLTTVSVSSGDYVEMGQPLASVARSNRMELRALVSQRYFDRLKDIDDANFRVPSSDGHYTVSDLNGELYSAGRMAGEGSTLIPVVFAFDSDGTIPDGTFAEVSLLGRRREGVITLPLTAITEQQGFHYIYVQLDAEGYQRREVKLGADDGLRVEILSGVEPGERVVTKGAINVKMASASASIPHGHTH